MTAPAWTASALANVSTHELQRAAGILRCERMLMSRPPEIEAEIDQHVAMLEAELQRREAK